MQTNLTVEEKFKALYDKIVTSKDTVDLKELKLLVRDYVEICDNVSTVYQSLTNGVLTKPHYPPDTVLGLIASIQKQTVPVQETFEDMLAIVGDDEFLKQSITEYFSK